MPTRQSPWPAGTPCWVDAQLDDLEAGRAFYADLFGWDVSEGPGESTGHYLGLLSGMAAAGLGPKPDDEAIPNAWTTYFATDDVDATTAAVTAAGGAVLAPPFDALDHGRMAVAADPSGAAFVLWQAGSFTGAQVFNEPGAYCWNELHTRDYEGAQAFYAAVFGYSCAPMSPSGEDEGYAVFSPAGTDRPLGGISDDTRMPGPLADAPAQWLTWFSVNDAQATAARAVELGGRVAMEPLESPIGTMAMLIGAQGEAFGVIATNS